ncbi:MAG: glycosyltransferase family 4 protein [Methylophilus sp.]|nr:glycosyltransferase family 4 protein [Methylophilus sp.]
MVVSQYFYPENFRINDLAIGFVEKGHDVTVLTGIPNYPKGSFFDGYGLFQRNCENYQGIKIVRCPLIPRGDAKAVRLALNYISFAFFACLYGFFKVRGKFDAIFVFQVSPITVGIPAIFMKWLKNAPIFFWVLDLWPESVIAASNIKRGWVINFLEKLTKWIYQHCDRILVQSKGFYAHALKMEVPQAKLQFFPNWAEELYQPKKINPELLAKLPSGFKIMFAGNIGVAQDFGSILAVAEKLRQNTQIQWLILGDGRERNWVSEEIKKRNLSDVFHLLGQFPIEEMPNYFACADALLVTLKQDPIFESTIPGKIQSYLACGKPILAMLDGEGAKVVNESGAGFACASEDIEGLVKATNRMFALSVAERNDMGKAGRIYYDTHFNRNQLFSQLEAQMLGLTKKSTIK